MVLEGDQIRMLVLSLLADRAGATRDRKGETGLRPDQLVALRNLAACDLARLAKMREPAITVQVDPPTLDHGLRALNYLRQRTEEVEYFVRYGATASMLVALFKLAPADVAAYRAAIGMRPGRRPPMPSSARREAICVRWCAIRSGREHAPPSASDYRALHQQFDDLSLASLHAVINEFAT